MISCYWVGLRCYIELVDRVFLVFNKLLIFCVFFLFGNKIVSSLSLLNYLFLPAVCLFWGWFCTLCY